MSQLERAGQGGALDVATSQAAAKEQLATLVDMMRQLGGKAETGPGALINDPLSAPYVLHVNPYIGEDTFVGGSYSTSGSATERIELQRLECGYTQSRPFKTINRAIIEAGIITAKTFYSSPLGNNDLVSIVLAPGAATVLNGAGEVSVTEWASGTNPSDAQLQAFNPQSTGGVLLPRGCSVVAVSSDLRKTIIRPSFVPALSDEAPNASNRRSIFKVTGTGYYWGLSFMDKVGLNSSHHLLHCFEFASRSELDEFYAKIRQAFGGANNTGGIDSALAVSRLPEYEIVGPRPASGGQTINTDTTTSASPYIFNCSIRSNFGLCGVYADGNKAEGFKSMVLAQFTGVSMQRDLSCWQKYVSNQSPAWGAYFANYADYINSDPDAVRMHTGRRSFHIRAVNGAIMQEVSVFAIGQGIHHWVQGGGELTVTNSNSNFGGCAALAEGYQQKPFISDASWNIGSLRVATNLAEKRNNIRKIYLGKIAEGVANNATTVQLDVPLQDSATRPGVPSLLDRDGYSLPANSYVWIENTRGLDYRAQLTADGWSSGTPDTVRVATAFANQDGFVPGAPIINSQGYDTGQVWPVVAGARIYVRRLQDARTTDERRFSLRCNNTTALSRTPLRDYVLQTTPGSGGVSSLIPDDAVLVVASATSVAAAGAGVVRSASVELRRGNAPNSWSSGTIYRPGDVVRYESKSFSCTSKNNDATFNPLNWGEMYVHMAENYRPEDFWKNAQPAILFDGDTDSNDNTLTCGYNLATAWATDSKIQSQYRTATDYRGVHSLLMSLGFSSANAHTILLPTPSVSRERNPANALDGIAAPSEAAVAWSNWAIEFRRPSNIRLFGHAYEWAGFLNYTKSLPEYQLELSPLNKFSYYFTSQNGGRVYGSGFNEEGFLVTPQGLQDLATGSEVAVESIGDSNVPIDEISFPTFYDELTANKLNVNTELNLGSGVVRGTPSWEGGYGSVLPALPASSATQAGIIELATTEQVQEFLRDDLAVTPATLIQALGDAIKSVVNLRISLSSTSAVPSGNQLNATSIFIHPYNGNELAIYSTASLRWQVVRFSGVQQFSLAAANAANTNYDIYIFNNGTALAPVLAVEYVPWQNDTTPPARGSQDGVIVRSGNPARRLIGVLRTTAAGTSTIDLGGTLAAAQSASYPRIYLANLFNIYDARAVYFFGTSWNVIQWGAGFGVVPSSVYATAPRISWVQASDTMAIAFLDIYNNPPAGGNASSSGAICYVAPGIDSTSGPPADAFYGEVQFDNSTAGSQWARALSPGKHDIYYLYQQSGLSLVNEHPAHGMIVTFKV